MPKDPSLRSVLIIGSGPIVIGQACEFDYSGSQAVRALKEEGIEVLLLNNNPATIMTDPMLADRVFLKPLTVESVEWILRHNSVDAILPTMGGQTALNLCREAHELGVLDRYGVRIIGADYRAIDLAENRDAFRQLCVSLGLPVPPSRAVTSLLEGLEFADREGYPVVIRPAYTLGGHGGGIAHSKRELEVKLERALEASPIGQALVEKALVGWKEFELEVMRDCADNMVVICTIENLDPMGIHTGDSVTLAPALTLPDRAFQRMRNMAKKLLKGLGNFAAGCNVQFALDPVTEKVVVIEVNPRVSRSSALASKATGFPIAKVAAKLAIGYRLDELKNPITGTSAFFEPVQDYVVVKIPRWNFEKFEGVDTTLTTQMKSVGEVMAIGRTFQEALQKACRSLELRGVDGLDTLEELKELDTDLLLDKLVKPSWDRLFAIKEALRRGISVHVVSQLTHIDIWFIRQIEELVAVERRLSKGNIFDFTKEDWLYLKRLGFSDKQIAGITGVDAERVRWLRHQAGVTCTWRLVDTCSAEFPALTPYYYSSYDVGENEAAPFQRRKNRKKLVILGAGPNRIGQGIEFDYCCVHGVLVARQLGYEAIMINCNPETVSTDFDISDRLYFEPLYEEHVMDIIEAEEPDGVVVQLGGQTALKLARALHKAGVPIVGTQFPQIDIAEDRWKFSELLRHLGIPYPPYGSARNEEEALRVARQIGYPVLVRPSYVLGGQRMRIVLNDEELTAWVRRVFREFPDNTILIDRFIERGTEAELDAICDGTDLHVMGVMEHIEPPGIHSGDSSAVLPPFSLTADVIDTMVDYAQRIARALQVVGFLNVQYVIDSSGKVHVIEANPRASRTVPFIAKAYGVPYASLGVRVMLGALRVSQIRVRRKLNGYAIKEPVFPWDKFPEALRELGPEMRSTGEAITFVKGVDDPHFRELLRRKSIYLTR